MNNKKTEIPCGILVVNKPAGFTSFDVIAKLRGILHIKRLGHTGTLDPMATGVLPVLVGVATKASDIMPENVKSYKAEFKLGLRTDTLDITGKITDKCEKFSISVQELENILQKYKGEIYQIPPMYSAVSVCGKRLYQLARQGIEVEREKRKAFVSRLELLNFDPQKGTGCIEITCSKGTYIRTIIDDFGADLKTFAVMTALERTSSNGFDISEAYTLEQIKEFAGQGQIKQILKPLEDIFKSFPKVDLNPHHTKLYKNGVRLRPDQMGINPKQDELYCVYDCEGMFLGLSKADVENNQMTIYKNFN